MCAQCSRIGTDIGAVVTELAAPLSAISALRRRDVFARDTNRRRSTSGGTTGGEGGASQAVVAPDAHHVRALCAFAGAPAATCASAPLNAEF